MRLGLRWKAILFAFTPIILMLAVDCIIWIYAYERLARDVVLQRDTELARITAARLSEQIALYTRELENLADMDCARSMDKECIKTAFSKAQYLLNVFDAVIEFNQKHGKVLCTFGPSLRYLAHEFPMKSEFSRLGTNLRPVVSNVFTDPLTRNDLILLAVPISGGGGEFMGALAGIATVKYSILEAMYSRVLELKAGQSGYAYLVDGNGRVIYHRHSSQIGRYLAGLDPVKRVIGGESGAVRTTDQQGEDIISGFAPVPLTPWGVITQENWKVIAEPILDNVMSLLVLLISGFACAGILVFLVVGHSLVGPVITLAKTSQEIAGTGNYSLRVRERPHRDEVGLLAESFNNMIEQVQRHEQDLNQTKNLLHNIVNSMPSMLISVNEEGMIMEWNEAASQTTGIPAIEAIGREVWEVLPFMEKFRSSIYEVLTTRAPREFHREVSGSDENEEFHNISLFPLISNCVKGIVIRLDNITELERKDQQLRQAQKMETIGTLAGGLAHDFNNILGGITGSLSLIKFKMAQDREIDRDFMQKYLGIMDEAGKRAIDLVKQLLSISRKQEMAFEQVDLNATMDHVMQICSNTFDKCIELDCQHSPERALVNASPTQMEQVLLNLCVNAAHAMTTMRAEEEHQGGRLSVTLRKIFADPNFCATHPEARQVPYWILGVQDTGVGMDTRTVAKIFDPFFTTKEKDRGTGLGLAMVYNIVQQHKGFIDVYSETGHGSTFNVFLPEFAQTIAEKKPDREEETPRGEGTVLVVDDEDMIRQTARAILEECGYTVILATDGKEALKIFRDRHHEIKAVILDMIMPKMSGKETFLEIRKIDPNVRVLISSGFKQDHKVESVIDLGVKGFVQKPYTLEGLALSIHKVIYG